MNTKNWRIDHNGFVTSEIIRKWEDPHGKKEISDDLMGLLSIYRKDKRFLTIVQ